MNTMNEISNNQDIKRPESLSILCVLTFIGSGLAAFSNLVIYLSFDMLLETYESGGLNLPGAEIIFAFSKSFFIISFLFYSISFAGALRMWKLKKIGFHAYAIAQILLLILPTLYVKTDQFPLFGVLITLAFILFYYRHLKFMH
jgi:hypothetical protein